MYAKHRDSNSFEEAIERKKSKREHPVNANNSELINMNDLIEKIDNDTGMHNQYGK